MSEWQAPNYIFMLCDCHSGGEGRMWCEDPIECEECGEEPTKYIRADFLPPPPQDAGT